MACVLVACSDPVGQSPNGVGGEMATDTAEERQSGSVAADQPVHDSDLEAMARELDMDVETLALEPPFNCSELPRSELADIIDRPVEIAIQDFRGCTYHTSTEQLDDGTQDAAVEDSVMFYVQTLPIDRPAGDPAAWREAHRQTCESVHAALEEDLYGVEDAYGCLNPEAVYGIRTGIFALHSDRTYVITVRDMIADVTDQQFAEWTTGILEAIR